MVSGRTEAEEGRAIAAAPRGVISMAASPAWLHVPRLM